MNRNRVNKKRMGGARVLSRAAAGMLAAALCFQPMTALAGPAGDSSLTFQWKCERGHIRAWRVPGDGE